MFSVEESVETYVTNLHFRRFLTSDFSSVVNYKEVRKYMSSVVKIINNPINVSDLIVLTLP